MTGDQVLADVLAANEAYAQEFRLEGLAPRAAMGLAVLTCMDSRIEPLRMLGLEPGDAKILRNAGARVTDDVLRTLVLASYLLGVDRAMVVAHTKCRMWARATRTTSTPRWTTPAAQIPGASRSSSPTTRRRPSAPTSSACAPGRTSRAFVWVGSCTTSIPGVSQLC